jgi:hypothetical protein
MSRKRREPQPCGEPARAEPLVILHPNAVYDAPGVQAALQLKRSTLRREIREGRLRVSRRGGKYLFLGVWLLQWIAGGEVKPKARAAAVNGTPTDN